MIDIKTDSRHSFAQIASNQRLPGAAADIEDAPMPLSHHRHHAARIVWIGRYREFQPVVI